MGFISHGYSYYLGGATFKNYEERYSYQNYELQKFTAVKIIRALQSLPSSERWGFFFLITIGSMLAISKQLEETSQRNSRPLREIVNKTPKVCPVEIHRVLPFLFQIFKEK